MLLHFIGNDRVVLRMDLLHGTLLHSASRREVVAIAITEGVLRVGYLRYASE